jgi:hypothetical protein
MEETAVSVAKHLVEVEGEEPPEIGIEQDMEQIRESDVELRAEIGM